MNDCDNHFNLLFLMTFPSVVFNKQKKGIEEIQVDIYVLIHGVIMNNLIKTLTKKYKPCLLRNDTS